MALKFLWTSHALERLSERGLTRAATEQAVQDLHPLRAHNDGAADWRIDTGKISVLYDHPVENDTNVVRIITAWPKRRKRKQYLKPINDEDRELS